MHDDGAVVALIGGKMVRLYKNRVWIDAGIRVSDVRVSAKTKCMQQSTADKPILYSMHSNNDRG